MSFVQVKGTTQPANISPFRGGKTCYFLSFTMADITILAALYQLSKSQTHWNTKCSCV